MDTAAVLAVVEREMQAWTDSIRDLDPDFITASSEELTAAAEARRDQHTARIRAALGITPEIAEGFAQDYDPFTEAVRSEVRRTLVRREAAKQLAILDTAGQPPIDVASLADVLNRPAPPRDRIAGLMPSDASTLVSAQRKTGKTTFCLNLAHALITGEDFLGRFPVTPISGTVALLNYEVSEHTIAKWAHEVGIDPTRLILVNLRGRRNPLITEDDRAALAATLKARGVEVVIVDTFARAYTGSDQNSSGEVTPWLTGLDQWVRSQVGATDLVLTVHAGWNGERTRGASGLEDWPDSIIRLTRDADDETQRYLSAMGRDVEVEEDRLDYHAPTRRLTLSGTGSRKESRQARNLSALAVYVVRAARQTPGLSVSAAEKAIRCMDDAPSFRNGEVAKAAEYAQQQGQLTVDKQGRGRPTVIYPVNLSQPLPTSPGENSDTSPTSPIGERLERERLEKFTDDEIGRGGLVVVHTCNTCGDPLVAARAELGFKDCPRCHARAAGIGA